MRIPFSSRTRQRAMRIFQEMPTDDLLKMVEVAPRKQKFLTQELQSSIAKDVERSKSLMPDWNDLESLKAARRREERTPVAPDLTVRVPQGPRPGEERRQGSSFTPPTAVAGGPVPFEIARPTIQGRDMSRRLKEVRDIIADEGNYTSAGEVPGNVNP